MSWRDFWNADTPIYVNERHKALHYGLVARDIAALIPSRDAAILDYGCGEALSAARVAAACRHLYLCDGAPLIRERLKARFRGDGKVVVLSPEEMETVSDRSLHVIIVNSLLQYLSVEEFGDLLSLWRRKLKDSGVLVLADVIPPDIRAIDDAAALLAFGWKGGFLLAALKGLARTAVSDYRKLRAELGLTHYSEGEMFEILRGRGFAAERRDSNLGHNPKRMTFLARPLAGD